MQSSLDLRLREELARFHAEKIYKRLTYLEGPQAARVRMEGRGEVIILSSNNYLGLSNEAEVVAAGHEGLDRFGAGTASVRFICGTFTVHRDLEAALARLVGTASSLSFVSCWNDNEALPGPALGEEDLVLSDQLNHASIIDGIRLAKAITRCQTGVYQHGNLKDLDEKLTAASDRRTRMVISDGVFSMEGSIVDLPGLHEVCRKHGAILVIDDSHATGRGMPSREPLKTRAGIAACGPRPGGRDLTWGAGARATPGHRILMWPRDPRPRRTFPCAARPVP